MDQEAGECIFGDVLDSRGSLAADRPRSKAEGL